MNWKLKQKIKRVFSITLVMTMVLSVIPYMPSGLLDVKAGDISWIDGSTVSDATKGEYYYFDFTQTDNLGNTASKYATAGTYGIMTTATGNQNALSWHGTTYGLSAKAGNSFTVKVPGNCYISVTGDNNSSDAATITATSTTGAFENDTLATKTAGHCDLAGCQAMGSNSVNFLYVGTAGEVTLTLNGSTAYIAAMCISPASDDVVLTQYEQKTFSLDINGVTTTVTSGATASDVATVNMGSGGEVEVAQVEKAIVWADLGGAGKGVLTQAMLSNISDNVTALVSDNNTITVSYKDTTKNPTQYILNVKDNSATGIPSANGTPVSYNFKDGSIISSLHGNIRNGSTITTTDKLLTLTGNAKIAYNGSHGIEISAADTVSVKVAGDATISFDMCAYAGSGATVTPSGMASGGDITPASAITKVEADGSSVIFEYTGDATTLVFTFGVAKSYIHSMTVTNKAAASQENVQSKMPTSELSFGTSSNLTVTPVGQRIILSQSNGKFTKNADNTGIDSSASYYLFPETTQNWTISADVVLTSCGASNANGIFFGAFNGEYAATVGIRNSTNIRGIYSKATDYAGAGVVDAKIKAGEKVSFTAQKTDEGFKITYKTASGEEGEGVFGYNSSSYTLFNANGKDTAVRYGFAIANANAKITNLKVIAEDNIEILYDQNDCYEAVGTAPLAVSVSANVDSSREFITVSWTGSACEDDGKYVLEASKNDGVTYEVVSKEIETMSYIYPITEAGTYKFRVSGIVGSNGDTSAAVESAAINVVAALASPTVTAVADSSKITVSWTESANATRYELYRRSADEDTAVKIKETTGISFTDASVAKDMPYYYYVIAYSSDNYSNPSDTVSAVVATQRSGDYVYEDKAADIFITKKSYDTVYKPTAVLEGLVTDKEGVISVEVNGTKVGSKLVEAKESFSFTLDLSEGRNDVNLYFKDANQNITRKTYNFVYLTNYNMVVDASYKGTDGSAVDGIPTYSTVQAAVNSVSASNSSRVVILIKEGSYDEHLVVDRPNITLIGEDRDKVNINFYDALESPEGGDTAKRCAVYIKSTATNFQAENLTIENTYEYLGDGSKSNESADALRVDADNSAFINVKMLGYQDTLDASINKQYYYKCYITGNVDFIYGSAQALFEDCDLVFRYSATKNSGYVTAPKTDADKYGYIFNNCRILSETGCSGTKYLLARPWGPNASATWINCYMGSIINATLPYSDMSGASYKLARFNEYYTYGPGFVINEDRPQISLAQANKMLSSASLGWTPQTSINSSIYNGSIVTDSADKYIENEYDDDSADTSKDDDTGLGAYSQEGYAQGVTGGGVILQTSKNYYKVSNAQELLAAITSIKTSNKPSVIEITNDIGLGSKEIGSALSSYSSIIKAHSNAPLLHPTLLETGVSMLKLEGMSNLTIYSQNGSSIKHACVDISGSSNIIIRNIAFDEIWEWDEATNGDYDRNDWDYMTIQNGSKDIWIDHCTFYKAYDGIIDVKKASATDTTDVTISWCSFLPGSEGSFFDDMMDLLESGDASTYPYYNRLKSEYDMTSQQIREYAHAQKKTHLIGASDTEANSQNLTLTLANNYYLNSMDRMPRLRFGNAHVYNCIMDSSAVYALRMSLTNEHAQQKVVSNGTISTCNASVLVENTYYSGIINTLLSGNGNSASGKINALNSVLYMNGVKTALEITDTFNTGLDKVTLDADAFKTDLPYDTYTLYLAEELSSKVQPYAGAGKVTMTANQWMKTAYLDEGSSGGDIDTPDDEDSQDVIDKVVIQDDWSEVIDAIENVTNGTTINVTLDNTTVLSTDVISAIAGKNVKLHIEVLPDVTWIIDGNDVDAANIQNVLLGVEINVDSIPADVINGISGITDADKVIQLSLNHNGEFGFNMTMNIKLSAENKGMYANLYYYNTETGSMDYVGYGLISEDGSVDLEFTHASYYAIVISSEIMNDDIENPTQEETTAPPTGDKTPITWLFVVMLVSGTVFVLSKKRKIRVRTQK